MTFKLFNRSAQILADSSAPAGTEQPDGGDSQGDYDYDSGEMVLSSGRENGLPSCAKLLQEDVSTPPELVSKRESEVFGICDRVKLLTFPKE